MKIELQYNFEIKSADGAVWKFSVMAITEQEAKTKLVAYLDECKRQLQ